MKNKIITFWIVFFIVLVSAIVVFVKPTKLGLDLVGGSRLVLEAQTTETIAKITPDMMDSLHYAIENRINKMGVAETLVQKVGEKRLLIEIPNISDLAKAKAFLGETAALEFKEPGPVVDGMQTWIATDLTGKDVSKALVSTSQNGQWVVDLRFNDKGVKKFGDLTSRLVGKPMAMLLLHKNGTVTICHSRTQNLAEQTRQADILVSAVGIPGFVTADMVKEGAVVIDVGMNRSTHRDSQGKLVGDVCFEEVAAKASAITPVPGGVGPMTRAILMRNTLTAAKLQLGE